MHTMRSTKLLMSACLGFFMGCQSSTNNNHSVLPGVDGIVFVKRAYLTKNNQQDVAGGAGQVVDYLRYDPGGGVFALSPPTPSGQLRNLTASFKNVDVAGLDLPS